jgi:hypothetical protein
MQYWYVMDQADYQWYDSKLLSVLPHVNPDFALRYGCNRIRRTFCQNMKYTEDQLCEVNQTPISFWYWNNLWTWHSVLFTYSMHIYKHVHSMLTPKTCVTTPHLWLWSLSVTTPRGQSLRLVQLLEQFGNIYENLKFFTMFIRTRQLEYALCHILNAVSFNISLNITSHLITPYHQGFHFKDCIATPFTPPVRPAPLDKVILNVIYVIIRHF